MVTGRVSASTATGRLEASTLRYRHHEQHDEQHERAGLLVDAQRMDENEGRRYAEEQVEQDEA